MSEKGKKHLFKEEIDDTIRRIELAKVSTKAMEEGKKTGVPHNIKMCLKLLESNEQIIKDKTTVIQQQSRTIQSQINENTFQNNVIASQQARIRYHYNLLQDERDFYMLDLKALKQEIKDKDDFIINLLKEKEQYIFLLAQKNAMIFTPSSKRERSNTL